ncbi:MAG: hypothetical protein JWP42_2023 [Pseudomonas sp.]|nr:hypothetical protein [Pseudomonas sp.]
MIYKIKGLQSSQNAFTCTVSTNPQHPVDNLCSNPFKVVGTLLRTTPESNQTGLSGL